MISVVEEVYGITTNFTVNTSDVNISGREVSFTMPIQPSRRYHIVFESGVLDNGAGDPFAGISSPTAWAFTTQLRSVSHLTFTTGSSPVVSDVAVPARSATLTTQGTVEGISEPVNFRDNSAVCLRSQGSVNYASNNPREPGTGQLAAMLICLYVCVQNCHLCGLSRPSSKRRSPPAQVFWRPLTAPTLR